MSLVHCKKCPLINDDCGPWDTDSTIFKQVFVIHKEHEGFGYGLLEREISELGKAVDMVLEQAFHDVVSECKGCSKVQQIKDKAWWEMINWTY